MLSELELTDDNPDGPLTEDAAAEMTKGLESDRTTFFDGFMQTFFSVDGELKVTEEQRQETIALSHQSDRKAALGCMEAFATTDFRDDLPNVTVPTLVIHGDGDGIVPFEGSGHRTHEALPHSELVLIEGDPPRLQRQPCQEVQRRPDRLPAALRSSEAEPEAQVRR